ncbi:MAG: hypothetical protein U0X39_13440 [Bacteroidales bacterium]
MREEARLPAGATAEAGGTGHRAQGSGLRARGTGHRAQGTGLRARGTGEEGTLYTAL